LKIGFKIYQDVAPDGAGGKQLSVLVGQKVFSTGEIPRLF
jgi:hypothetical protein